MPADVQDKKEAIIKAAFKLFTERGFYGTPTSMISQEAGVATGTLFRYFPTKEDLINSAYAIAKSHMAASLRVGIDEEPTFESQARRIWGNTIRWGLQNPEEFLFLEQFASSPYITKLTEKEAMNNFVFLGEVFEKGIRDGIIKDASWELLAEMIFESNKAVIKSIARSGLQDEADELIDESFSLLWRGIGTS
jgi:AcrR family transcriptional regulator